jgi:hypothetical protein
MMAGGKELEALSKELEQFATAMDAEEGACTEC